MLEALIAGERDPQVLAQMAKGRMRTKINALTQALIGRFGQHHAFLCRMHLDRLDALGGGHRQALHSDRGGPGALS
jgi:transposase